ncbi:protein of unknown function [Lactobacillus bombicola]|uniref:IrrE N-terminal-like domain-containing protein n=3 Tax=Lactobacillus bombicola TaxID=1505723 RepID=A0A1I1TTS9_9LACO|nr:protein of unknown function [Lactobacillus bombicola]
MNWMTNNEDVMLWLKNYCKKHKIIVTYRTDLSPKDNSYSYRFPRIIYLNDNYIQHLKPFVFAHEIGHAMCAKEDLVTDKSLYSARQHNEFLANKFAIRLLFKYCRENDIHFNSIYTFAEAFGIPNCYFFLLENLMKKMLIRF